MARNTGTVTENQFIQGLFTEATGMNFPPKAASDCINVRFDRTGAIKKRNGFRYEDSFNFSDNPSEQGSDGVTKAYLWKGVGNDGSRTFLVLQNGNYLTFWEADQTGEFVNGLLPFFVNLSTYLSGGNASSVGNAEAGIVAGNGRLFVTHPYCNPLYIKYNDDTGDIDVTSLEIQIRDFEGVEDGTAIGERPKTLTNLHKYNLYNQGWDQGKVPQGRDKNRTPIAAWLDILGVYPSNSDVWWLGKGINKDGQEAITEKTVKLISKATGFAPKGHYIYNAFDMNRSGVSKISGIPGKTSEGLRPSVCAFYAGRVFFAGVPHPDYQGKVYYSQIVEGDSNIGRCFQVNDPTSEQQSDLLDTDGGEIKVTGMGKVAFMVEVGNSLFIFANNGIWAIGGSGAEGTGFVATDFSIKKVSSNGTESSLSFVDVGGTPVWWNYDGIWTISEGGVESLSNTTIKTFIQEEIPGVARRYVQGAYNPLTQTVQWLYSSTNPGDWSGEGLPISPANEKYKYDRVLEFDTLTKAFYPFTIPSVNAIFCASDLTFTELLEDYVLDNSDVIVQDNGDNNLTEQFATGFGYSSSKFKYYAKAWTD